MTLIPATEFEKGTLLWNAAAEAADYLKTHEGPLLFRFNDVTFEIDRKMTDREIFDAWHENRERLISRRGVA